MKPCVMNSAGHIQAPETNTWRDSPMFSTSTLLYFFLWLFHFTVHYAHEILFLYVQFSNFGTLESHGFARNRIWEVEANPPPLPLNSCSSAFVDLILRPTEDDLKIWPNK